MRATKIAKRLIAKAPPEVDGDALDDNSELVLSHALGEVFSLRGPDGMDKAVLRQNVLSLAQAVSRVDKAGKVAPEHILEAFQYLADFSSLYSFLKEKRMAPPSHAEDQRGQLVGGPGSPIHGRIESVFREWGRPVPEVNRESFQEFAESVGFKFSGPVPWPEDAPPSARDAGMKRKMHGSMLDRIVAKVCESITAKKTVKQRARGTSVFQSTHPKVKDNKDHFPINDLAHARNALARVMQYDSVPSWYNGTLGGLQSAVKRAVYKKFPGLKSRKKERKKAASDGSDVVPTEVEILVLAKPASAGTTALYTISVGPMQTHPHPWISFDAPLDKAIGALRDYLDDMA